MQHLEWERAVCIDAVSNIGVLPRSVCSKSEREEFQSKSLRLFANPRKIRRGEDGYLSHLSIHLGDSSSAVSQIEEIVIVGL